MPLRRCLLVAFIAAIVWASTLVPSHGVAMSLPGEPALPTGVATGHGDMKATHGHGSEHDLCDLGESGGCPMTLCQLDLVTGSQLALSRAPAPLPEAGPAQVRSGHWVEVVDPPPRPDLYETAPLFSTGDDP